MVRIKEYESQSVFKVDSEGRGYMNDDKIVKKLISMEARIMTFLLIVLISVCGLGLVVDVKLKKLERRISNLEIIVTMGGQECPYI